MCSKYYINPSLAYKLTIFIHFKGNLVLRMLSLVERINDCGVPSPSWYSYWATSITKTQGKSQEDGEERFMNQRTKISVARWCRRAWQGSCTREIPTTWLPKQDLYNENTSWHANVTAKISQGPIPRWKAIGNQLLLKEGESVSSRGKLPDRLSNQKRLSLNTRTCKGFTRLYMRIHMSIVPIIISFLHCVGLTKKHNNQIQKASPAPQ